MARKGVNGNGRAASASALSQNSESHRIQPLELHVLAFDERNPRFGPKGMTGASDQEILDEIVASHGVSDILSSLAENGYLEAEPLIGERTGDRVRVIEGIDVWPLL